MAQKRACLVYVTATQGKLANAREELQANGFDVCEVKAEIEVALAAKTGEQALPVDLADCIKSSDLCVFLIPEEETKDGLFGAAAGFSNSLQKPVVGIVSGARATYPEEFDDHAHSILRIGSKRLKQVIDGDEIWEKPDGSVVVDRPIKNIRCQ